MVSDVDLPPMPPKVKKPVTPPNTNAIEDAKPILQRGPPGVFRRLAVIVYDSFLLFAVLFVATLIPAYILSPEMFAAKPANDSVVHELNIPMQGWIYRVYLVALIILFYGWFWRKSGQTLGMQAWRIKLESVSGGKPSWSQCVTRVLVAGVSFAAAGLGYWWIWLDKEGRSWHDLASKTVLRSIPKDKKKA